MDNYPDWDKFKQTNAWPEWNTWFQSQLRGLKKSITWTQQKEKNENESDEKRVNRITQDLSNAFDRAKMSNIVPKPYVIEWCGHETGGFYTGPYHYTKDGINKQTKQASMVCDQWTHTLQLDRNSSPSAITWLTLDGKKIYGWHNYSNITQKSTFLSQKIKNRGFMDSTDVIFDENRKPTPMQNNLAIFSNIDEYMWVVKDRLIKAKINTQDDMMSMFAKLSAYTGYNWIWATNIIEYANSGFIRQARKLSTTSTTPEIIIPSWFSIHDALKRTKKQLENISLMEEIKANNYNGLVEVYKNIFDNINEGDPTILKSWKWDMISVQYPWTWKWVISLKKISTTSIDAKDVNPNVSSYTRYSITST
jgi:hypothetical protein